MTAKPTPQPANKTFNIIDERVVEISNNFRDKNNAQWFERVIFAEKGDYYLYWENARSIETARNVIFAHCVLKTQIRELTDTSVEMTIEEIERKLGHKVKIKNVAEKN